MAGSLLTRIDVRGSDADLHTLLARPADEDERIAKIAGQIVGAVRAGGDQALRGYTAS